MTDPFISVRKYIKWEDEPASENTNTLVLTTRSNHYIDIRILLPHPLPNDPSNPSLISRLEWAFAGTCITTPASTSPSGPKPAHTIWNHWIDSNSCSFSASLNSNEKKEEGEGVDEGDMYPQSDGTVLEYGKMMHPVRRKLEAYVECWVDLEVERVGREGEMASWVLVCEDSVGRENGGKRRRGMIVRVGHIVQGLVVIDEHEGVDLEGGKSEGKEGGTSEKPIEKDGAGGIVVVEADRVRVIRWEWQSNSGDTGNWARTVAIGRLDVPDCLFEEGNYIKEGNRFTGSDKTEWNCVESYCWK